MQESSTFSPDERDLVLESLQTELRTAMNRLDIQSARDLLGFIDLLEGREPQFSLTE